MRITKQQIELIANEITKELCNNSKAIEEAREKAQPYLEEFKKSEAYKEFEHIFDLDYISSIHMTDHDFRELVSPELFNKNFGGSYISCFNCIKDIDEEAERALINKLKRKEPCEYELKEKVVFELTLKSLGCDDIYALLDDIKTSMKEQFNLL